MQCSFNTDAEALTFLNRHVAQCEKQCEDKMDIMDHDARCYAVFPNEAQNDNYEVWLQKYPPSNPVQHPDFEAQAAIAMVAVVEALSDWHPVGP